MNNKIEFIPAADSFVGISIENNQIKFYYPETFNFLDGEESLIRKQILSILYTFSLTKKSDNSDTLNSKYNENQEYPLLSYLWILQDYLTYHSYINRETNYKVNGKGKINWKKTIRQTPYISGANFVHPNIINEEKKNADVLLTDIYKHCVVEAIKIVGWLFNIEVDDYLKKVRYQLNKLLFCTVVRKELAHSFEDTKRIRLSHMLNILTGLDDSVTSSKHIMYGVNKYDVIYEKMLFNIFFNGNDIKKYYPSADWLLLTDNKKKKSSNLRPDIIMINDKEKKAYILDAKYYRFGTTFDRSDLPDSSSIQKQITYSEYNKNSRLKGYTIYNAFLLPYNRFQKNEHGFNKVLEFFGIASVEASESVNNKVVGILIDFNFIIENWTKYNSLEAEQLSKLIEENQPQ